MRDCKYEGCSRKHVGKGLCDAHRKQMERGKELAPIRQRNKTCAFDECGRKHYARSYCLQHYRQNRRGVEIKVIRKWVRKQEELT